MLLQARDGVLCAAADGGDLQGGTWPRILIFRPRVLNFRPRVLQSTCTVALLDICSKRDAANCLLSALSERSGERKEDQSVLNDADVSASVV